MDSHTTTTNYNTNSRGNGRGERGYNNRRKEYRCFNSNGSSNGGSNSGDYYAAPTTTNNNNSSIVTGFNNRSFHVDGDLKETFFVPLARIIISTKGRSMLPILTRTNGIKCLLLSRVTMRKLRLLVIL